MRSLTTDELLSCTRGMRQYRVDDWGLQLFRYPDEVIARFAETEEWEILAQAPSGVRFEFLTDSPTLSLFVNLGRCAREHAFIDVYVDGIFTASLGDMQPGDAIIGEVPLPAPRTGDQRRVVIYLPHLRRVGVREIALAAGASFKPAPPRETLLVIGASISEGMDAVHPSLSFAATCARELELDLFNYAMAGHFYENAVLPSPPVPDPPALITLGYGHNDWGRGMTGEEARPFITRLREFYPNTPIAVLAPNWRADADGHPLHEGERCFDDYRRTLATVAGEFPPSIFIPRECIMPAGLPFVSDGVHPTTHGHMVYGHNLAVQLRPLLAQRCIVSQHASVAELWGDFCH